MGKNKQNKKLFALQCKSLLMLAAFLFPILGQASPNNFNFQANIRKPDGSRLEDSNVSYRFSYLNALGTCTIYTEDFNNVSMIGTGGNISFSMGTGTKVFPPASVSLSETFNNSTSNLMSCSEGGSYTPLAATEIRKLKVEFFYTGSGGVQSLNGIEISSVPYSMYSSDSDRLGGVMANLFTKISDFQTCTAGEFLYKDGAGNFYCDTPSSFSGNLSGDVTGTQASTTVARLRGIPLAVTAPTVNQVLQFDGTNWVPQTIAVSGGTVTNVSSSNLYLTVANPTTTPTLTLNVGTGANTVAAGDDSRIVGAFQTATTLGGDLSGTLPNPTVATVGGKTAAQISTSVDETLNATNAATASRIVKRDGSGNASFVTAQATNFSGRNLILFEPTDTNYVTVTAPTTFTGGNYVLTLPESNGSPGQVLSTDGNGVTSWIPASTGSVTSVGATLPLTSTGGATPVIAMPAATGAVDGYLSAANFTTFNNKVSSQWTNNAADIYFNTGNVGIGTSSPISKLQVAGAEDARINVDAFGTFPNAGLVGRSARGPQGALTESQADDYILYLGAKGYDGSAYTSSRGFLTFRASENFTNTAQGTYASIATTATGGTVTAERMRITPSGNVGIGTITPAYKLDVNGDINIPTGSNFKINGVNVGTGTIGGSGTTNKISKFTAAGTIGDSNITDNGTTVVISTDATVSGVTVGKGGGSSSTNTTIGTAALSSNTTGTRITAIGNSALTSNTTGANNTAIGYEAMKDNLTGWNNIALGPYSLENNISGNSNVAIGYGTLNLNNSGGQNVALGHFALSNSTTGSNNIGLGYNSGNSITTGSNNVVLGANTGAGIATTNNNIIISDGSGNIRQQIDSSGLVGIGMTPSTYMLSVNGDINIPAGSNFKINGTNIGTGTVTGTGTIGVIPKFTAAGAIGNSNINDNGMFVIVSTDAVINSVKVGRGLASVSTNTAVGTNSLGANTTGNQNTALGYFSLYQNTTGAENTAIGSGTMYNNTTGVSNTAVGSSSLNQNTTGNYNSAFGVQALTVTTSGSSNTAVGAHSLYTNTTGSANSGVGFQSLYANTTGFDNTASGASALHDNTIGYYNTASGSSALGDNINGNYNTATGSLAMQLNTSGSDNVANGVYALRANTSGNGNISIGSNSMYNNTTGAYNVVNGHQALYNNTTGSYNVATGYQSMFNNTTAGSNVAYGSYSLNANTTGNSNTGLGTLALYSNITGGSNTAVGSSAMRSNTTGMLNVALGVSSLYNNTTGGSNVAVGGSSQYNTTTAYYNSSIGYQSLYYNTTGGNNTASGTETLYNNTIGAGNAASGYRALYSNTSGNYNTAHGSGALYTNSTASYNTASGSSSLFYNTTGTNNNAYGSYTLYSNTTGNYNNAYGNNSLYSNTTGNYNNAYGNNSLYYNTTGSNNTANGSSALHLNTTGSDNMANGYRSLYSNTIGTNNTASGNRALYTNKAKSESTAFGFNSMLNADDTLTASTAYNTAIGAYSLQGSGLASANTGIRNTAIGHSALMGMTSGSNNIGLGWNSGSAITTGSNNVVIGSNNGTTIAATSNNIIISDGAGNIRTQIDASGNMGIGVAPTADKLTVYNGTTTGAYTTSGWTHSSDARLKHDITPLKNSLDKVLKLKGVEYVFNNDSSKTKQIGFIAQQVETIFPEVVRTDEKGFKSMIYSNLVAPIIEAIKSLKLMTDTNTREIASLKAENADLKKQLDKQNKDMEQIKKKLGL